MQKTTKFNRIKDNKSASVALLFPILKNNIYFNKNTK